MKNSFPIIAAIAIMFALSSCVKDRFDTPPTGGVDPDLTVNFSIDSVKARFTGGTYYQFTDDKIISAIVVGDDKSGNLYKNLAIEDSTGGISLLIDGSYLYTNMPIGRRVFIKLKGLYVTQYKGLYQIAGYINADGSIGGVPSAILNKSVIPGKWGLTVMPKVVSISQLNDSYQSELIELDGVEFASADADKIFADSYNKYSLSRILKDCHGGSVEVYTSGYADFAGAHTPSGNGKMLCIYSVYNGAGQLIIRDLSDLSMDSTRCGGTVVTGNGIAGVASSYQGSDVVLPSGKTITGIVISDKDFGNIDPKNMVIQDSTGGIVVRFTATHSFALGDKVTVDVSGLTLTSYNGLLEILNTPASAATANGTGTITPRVATISQINANSLAWQSTLLTVQSATLSGTGTYSGSQTLTDATGNVTLYTRSAASFSGASLPTGSHTVTGFLGNFNAPQFQIRNTTDVQ